MPELVGLVCMISSMHVFVQIYYHDYPICSSTNIFYADNILMGFDPCLIQYCVAVPTEDDDVVEKTKRVVIHLERTDDLDNRITIGVPSGEIEIMDNDSVYYYTPGIVPRNVACKTRFLIFDTTVPLYLQWFKWVWRRCTTSFQKTQ